jgi:hypothetical protein
MNHYDKDMAQLCDVMLTYNYTSSSTVVMKIQK